MTTLGTGKSTLEDVGRNDAATVRGGEVEQGTKPISLVAFFSIAFGSFCSLAKP